MGDWKKSKRLEIKKELNNEKVRNLYKILEDMESALISFSGGVDSTFLLMIAREALDNILVVTANSAIFPSSEIRVTEKITDEIGVEHRVIDFEILELDNFRKNPENRCYYCKKNLFEELLKIASDENLNFVADGTTSDDLKDYRPGLSAARELNIRSPLAEANLGKGDIRRFSKKLGIPIWDKPPTTCLATRISYGTKINRKILSKIEKLEAFLKNTGFETVRVRDHKNIARIEINRKNLKKAVDKREKILEKFRKENYDYITLDLAGYDEGSLNKEIEGR